MGNHQNPLGTDILLKVRPVAAFPYLLGVSRRVDSLDIGLPLQFAATACTIVSGAIAERTKFETYILYSFFMAAWVYPVLTHSIWSTAGWAGMFR